VLRYFEGKILPTTDDSEQPLPVLNINQGRIAWQSRY